MTTLDWLPEDEVRAIDAVVEASTRGAGEKLRSVSLVGAWVPPVWSTVAGRVELLIVLSEAPMFVLGNLAHQVRQRPEAERLRLVIMTEHELLRATDVFTLELADYAARHHVVHGRDPLGDLYFTPAELRLGLERRLRYLARDVRETMITGAWHDGRPVELRSVMKAVVADLLVVSHHLARLNDAEPATEEDGLLGALADLAKVDEARLVATITGLRREEPFDRPVEALGELLEAIDGATRVVDAMGVATP